MSRKRVYPRSLALSATPAFSEVMEDAKYTSVSVHDSIQLTMTHSLCLSGRERLKCLSKEDKIRFRTENEGSFTAPADSSMVIELTGSLCPYLSNYFKDTAKMNDLGASTKTETKDVWYGTVK